MKTHQEVRLTNTRAKLAVILFGARAQIFGFSLIPNAQAPRPEQQAKRKPVERAWREPFFITP